MFYSELTKKAALISYEMNKDEVDYNGYPLFLHLSHLASLFNDEEHVCVALLFKVDFNGDSKYTEDFFRNEFPESIMNSLLILSQRHKPYLMWLKMIKEHQLTREVAIQSFKIEAEPRKVIEGEEGSYNDIYVPMIKMLEE